MSKLGNEKMGASRTGSVSHTGNYSNQDCAL